MNTKLEKQRLRARAERLIQLINNHAPDNVLANEVLCIWKSALLVCGRTLMHQWGDWLRARVNVSAGICPQCGSADLPSVVTRLPLCAACVKSNEAEVAAIELESIAIGLELEEPESPE